MHDNLLVQLGGALLTLITIMIGIFKGLMPRILESFEKRLADKDKTLEQQQQALDEVCGERKEMTDRFLCSLKELVAQNSSAMSELTSSVSEFRKQMHDDHAVQHENHRDILDLLHEKKKPRSRTAAKST